MKIIILGSQGMAGHIITHYLKSINKYNIITIARRNANYIIDIEKNLNELYDIIIEENADIIINCIGLLIKDSKKNIKRAIFINTLFPHWLEKITKNTKTKIIHLSTDCIFDGTKGNYSETDIPTEKNNYGKTKAAGEINNTKDLTLRLSIIGTEIKENGTGLLHWFLHQKGEIKGFTNCIWNGITTLELAKVIHYIIKNNISLSGIYHLVPDFHISKYKLLCLIKKIWNKTDVTILEEPNFYQNKTLINNRKQELKYIFPNYCQQLKELYEYTK